MKKVKIIATIGPKSVGKLKKMKENGVDIGRINTKYGDEREFDKTYEKLKKLNVEVMFDIKNLEYINYLKGKDFDWLAVSYARSKSQINKIRKKFPKKIKIISKIECNSGIKNIDSLIDASNGIMVARGDLSKNVSYEKVPIFQKIIIRKANEKKKFVITATEMLLSLQESKSPKRAEISDIANAVLDGSDALMLSEETAIGRYPSVAVDVMRKSILSTLKNKKFL